MYSFTIVAVVFWLFVAASVVVPVVTQYKSRRATMDVIRAAIEKGHDLSPDVVKNLTGIGGSLNGIHDQPVRAVQLRIAAVIVMGTGLGAAAVATVFALVPEVSVASPFIYAGAALVFFIGGGLHYGAKILKEHEHEHEQEQEQKDSNPVA